MTIEELKVLISVEMSGVERELNKAKNLLKGFEKSINKSSNNIKTAFNNMFQGAKLVGVSLAIGKVSKSAIKLASDLAEVQNVVDVAFGKASASVEKFSKRSLSAFGLNELAAKRMASTFMAMSNSFEIATEKGELMSLNLTALAGDMASFFNVSEDIAETALHSVFTGETESLKKFGVVMTDANLKAFALAKGIKKQYKEFSQADKVMLRYCYTMETLKQTQGDFVRTQVGWANQLRVLSGRWGQLLSIIGQGLIAVLTPMVGVLNRILSILLSVANAFAAIFGGSQLKKGTGEIAGGAGDISDNLNEATGNAKKLKKTIAGFDELEVLKDNSNSGADLSGLGATMDMDLPSYYETIVGSGGIEKGFNEVLKQFDENILKFHSKIEEFFAELGERFSNGFASIDWVLLGKTIGDGINLVYDSLNAFLENQSWYGYGVSLALGINSAFDTIDWVAIGQNAANNMNALIYTLHGAVNMLDFTAIGTSLKTRFDTMISNIDWSTAGQTLATGINGAFESLSAFLEGGTLVNFGTNFANAINNVFANMDATAIGEGINQLANQIIDAIGQIDWTLIGEKFRQMFEAIDIVGIIKNYLDTKKSDLAEALKGFFDMGDGSASFLSGTIVNLGLLTTVIGGILGPLTTLSEKLFFLKNAFGEGLHAAIDGTVGRISNFFGISNSQVFTEFPTVIGSIGDTLKESKIGQYFQGWQDDLSGFFTTAKGGTPAAQALNGSLAMMGQSGNKMGVMLGKMNVGFSNLFTVVKAHPFAAIVTAIVLVTTSVKKLWDESEEFRKFISEIYEETIAPLWEQIQDLWDNHLKPLWEEDLKPIFESFIKAIKDIWDVVSTVVGWVVGLIGGVFMAIFGDTFEAILKNITNFIDGVKEFFDGLIMFFEGAFSGDWSKAWEGIKKILKGVWDSMINIVKAPINIIIGLINGMIKGVTSGINVAIRAINRIHVKVPDWIPIIGGETFGFNIKELTAPKIPLLANGGVIDNPTVAMMGEYPGASNNPEIVTPQNILRETINASNNELIDAMYQMCKQLIGSIEDVDMTVSIGDDVIAQSAMRGGRAYEKRTGKPLFAY